MHGIQPFARGFALAQADWQELPTNYVERPLGHGWRLHHDSCVAFGRADAAESSRSIVLLGTVIDVTDGRNGCAAVATGLLREWQRSEDSLFDAIDRLSGRFILVLIDGPRLRLLHDATGMRSVFHAVGAGQVWATSHAELLRQKLAAPDSELQRLRFRTPRPLDYKFGFPGNATPYEGVHCLTPNTLLELDSGRITRYFPRRPPGRRSIDEAVEEVLPLLRRQAEWLAQGTAGRWLTSLTAGLDSRLTLAICRPWLASTELFTYQLQERPDSLRDVRVAREIAARLGLPHVTLDTAVIDSETAQFAAFESTLRRSCYYHHNYRVAYLYARQFGTTPAIHLRSNLGEIVRGGYEFQAPVRWLADYVRVMPRNVLLHWRRILWRFDAHEMVRLYRKPLLDEPAVVGAFQRWYTQVSFDRLHGYDPYDMFYWEHRMGTWHSQVLLESDPAFESHVVFNSRAVLNPLLGVALADRLAGTVFQRILQRELPELAGLAVNPAGP